MLEICNLYVSVDGREIVKGLNLKIRKNEVHALMGPNASGKSTLAYALMGNPKYKITKGRIFFDGKNISKLRADERARLGLFLGFQYPCEISGVTLFNFLRNSYNATHKNELSVLKFKEFVLDKLHLLKMDESFINRYLNEGFSGGEKKRCEILQLAVLQPKIAVLDETDSGLDIDTLKIVSDGIKTIQEEVDMGILLITHYQRILKYIKPKYVHVMIDGKIVVSDGYELAEKIEKRGYEYAKTGL